MALITVEYLVGSFTGFHEAILEKNLIAMKENFDPEADPEEVEYLVGQLGTFLSILLSEIGQKFIILPLMIVATWLFYKRYRSGFKSHIWFTLYTLAHVKLITIPLILAWYFGMPHNGFIAISLSIGLFYWYWVSRQFYGLSRMRAVSLTVFYWLVYFIFFSLIGGIFGIYIATANF